MAVYLCSVYDAEKHVGSRYCTAVKQMVGHGVTATVDCLVPLKEEMVWAYRYKGMSEQEYTRLYFKLLSDRWEAVRPWLKSLEPAEDITLLCFCREGQFCHRKLIGRVINRYRPDITIVTH